MFKLRKNQKSRDEIIQDHILSLTNGKDYGLCAPPMKAQVAVHELCRHFLGDNWYTSMPVQEQANTEIVYAIESRYSGDRQSWKKLKKAGESDG